MKKKGMWDGILISAVIWGLFVALVAWVFWSIVSDMTVEAQASYKPLILLFAAVVYAGILLKSYLDGRLQRKNYRDFEVAFPELKNGISDLETVSTYFTDKYEVAIYKNHFISNWQFAYIDLAQVDHVYYELSAGIRRRTGSIGEDPQIAFITKSGEKQVIKIYPYEKEAFMIDAFGEMARLNPSLTFGKEGLTLSQYLEIFKDLR